MRELLLASVRRLVEATTSRVQAARENGVAYDELAAALDLEDFRRHESAGETPERPWAWHSCFVAPGPESAWMPLGYPVPAE